MSGAGRVATPALARRHESIAASDAGSNRTACAAPVQRKGPGSRSGLCPDCPCARLRAWVRKYNRERNRKRYATDPEFRERIRVRIRKRREVTRGPSRRGRNLLVRLIVRQGALCGNRLPEYAADIHVDHIVPVSKGSTSDPENLQAVCANCNQRKGDRV